MCGLTTKISASEMLALPGSKGMREEKMANVSGPGLLLILHRLKVQTRNITRKRQYRIMAKLTHS